MGVDVAALYVDPRGPYPKIPGVDCYDEARNAEMFPGGMPVVAHPPCGPWGRLKHLSRLDDPAHALHAVDLVRECGGALEHPAHSLIWKVLSLPLPGDAPDAFGGYTVAVNQCDWGHVARKATWLYLVRVPAHALETPTPREPTHWIGGFRRKPDENRYGSRGSIPEGIKACSKQQRRRTPEAFAAYLVKLARSVKR